MTIQLIFKIAAVGIVVALINQVLKHSGRDDQAYLVSLAGLIIVLTWIIPYVNQLFQDINTLFGFYRLSALIPTSLISFLIFFYFSCPC